jgi:hypothetical protein
VPLKLTASNLVFCAQMCKEGVRGAGEIQPESRRDTDSLPHSCHLGGSFLNQTDGTWLDAGQASMEGL